MSLKNGQTCIYYRTNDIHLGPKVRCKRRFFYEFIRIDVNCCMVKTIIIACWLDEDEDEDDSGTVIYSLYKWNFPRVHTFFFPEISLKRRVHNATGNNWFFKTHPDINEQKKAYLQHWTDTSLCNVHELLTIILNATRCPFSRISQKCQWEQDERRKLKEKRIIRSNFVTKS